MTANQDRDFAVRSLCADAEASLAADGVTRAGLAGVLDRLIALAARRDFWIGEEFTGPDPGQRHARYLIHQHPDRTFALYLNIMLPGNLIVPHNHTTWASIAAVDGTEYNHLYLRTDDGTRPGRATLNHQSTVAVTPGGGIALLPDDIHAVEIKGSAPIRHLHLYGRSLDTLSQRIRFDLAAGTCEPMPLGVPTRSLA
jgi:predicted metal-dependent enzyme (double-stranded beta helix superfamily)